MINKAIEKIKKQLSEVSKYESPNCSGYAQYLLKELENNNQELATLVLKEEKSLKNCDAYMKNKLMKEVEEAQKNAKNGDLSFMVNIHKDDNTVYAWIVEYYKAENLNEDKKPAAPKKNNSSSASKKGNKSKAKEKEKSNIIPFSIFDLMSEDVEEDSQDEDIEEDSQDEDIEEDSQDEDIEEDSQDKDIEEDSQDKDIEEDNQNEDIEEDNQGEMDWFF